MAPSSRGFPGGGGRSGLESRLGPRVPGQPRGAEAAAPVPQPVSCGFPEGGAGSNDLGFPRGRSRWLATCGTVSVTSHSFDCVVGAREARSLRAKAWAGAQSNARPARGGTLSRKPRASSPPPLRPALPGGLSPTVRSAGRLLAWGFLRSQGPQESRESPAGISSSWRARACVCVRREMSGVGSPPRGGGSRCRETYSTSSHLQDVPFQVSYLRILLRFLPCPLPPSFAV